MLYLIEKTKSPNFPISELIELNNLFVNAEHVHKLLGKLFNHPGDSNWRSKYNVLYRQYGPAKWLVSSDCSINAEAANRCKVKYQLLNQAEIKPGDVVKFVITASTYRKEPGAKNRTFIKTPEDRKAWMETKLSRGGQCDILSLKEVSLVRQNMQHEDISKGSSVLTGYDYECEVKVRDEAGFKELLRCGIGPEKSYGFGLIEVRS